MSPHHFPALDPYRWEGDPDELVGHEDELRYDG